MLQHGALGLVALSKISLCICVITSVLILNVSLRFFVLVSFVSMDVEWFLLVV